MMFTCRVQHECGFLELIVLNLGFICVGVSWKNQSFEANDMQKFGDQNESVDGNFYCNSLTSLHFEPDTNFLRYSRMWVF